MKSEKLKLKLDMSDKRVNIVVTVICVVLVAIIGVYSAVDFLSFRKYQTEFVLRDGVVDEVIKFHEYSKNLEGTAGDSDIYVINGTENTVALVAAAKAETYANGIPSTAKICAVEQNQTQIAAAKQTLGREDFTLVESVSAAVAGVNGGTYDVAVLRHEDAKTAVKSNSSLAIADATLEKVPSLLVIGGTHPNEPSGQITATLFLENAKVQRGILYVITELNRSAFTHSMPQEASPEYYSFDVAGTTRTFKFGSRASNTVDQWPSPDVYTHSSGQQLSASEVRNINRAYPGSENGTYTEQIAWTVTNFVLQNNVTMVIDLHEASPEYAVINAMVYHQDSDTIASNATLFSFPTIFNDLKMEKSAYGLHGLTHRELGDYTGAYVFLFETSNASQGKIRGVFTEDLILYDGYTDPFYEVAYEKGLLYAPATSINTRVARHTESITSIIAGYNMVGYSRSSFAYSFMENPPESVYLGDFVMSDIPTYQEMEENGVAAYLLPSQR